MNEKEQVAKEAINYIKDGMIIGLGTGSTANLFIDFLSAKVKQESLNIKVVASSTVSQIRAINSGLSYISLDQIESIDLYIDGADEVTKELEVLKGRGYDLVREKLLAKTSKQFIVIGDKSKMVAKIGEKFPIPIEITPIAWKIAKKLITEISQKCDLRPNAAGDAYAITSYGNYVLDCEFKYDDLSKLASEISQIPGVIEHGIFLDMTHLALIADQGNIMKYS
ncbi:MAG: ribose 5-phosphate isomerase A [Methylophilaceae bacterium]|jgi:ribose 5-phosphate isomerase A